MEAFEDLSEKNIDQNTDGGLVEEGQAGELLEIVLNTREQCEMMEQLIKNQITVKDEMIDKLYKELEYYKQEAADRFVEQFLKAFIKIHKDMGRMLNSEQWQEKTAEDLRREFRYTYEDITDLFEQQNMDVYHSEYGDEFNPAIHQPKIEYTADYTLDKKIKASVSDGYKRGNKVIIPERVIVFQFKE